MAIVYWSPNAANVAQVATLVVTAAGVGGTLSAIINTKYVTYTCITGDTTSTAATAWAALLNSNDAPPEFQEITWTVSSATITGTADTPGTPFTLTKSDAGGATSTLTATTANSSQSDVNDADNWLRSGVASLPQNGDEVIVANTSIPLLWNLDALAAVQFLSFARWQSFTGTIGLPENNPAGYIEYRPTYFQFSGSAGSLPITLGQGAGTGPARERYNTGTKRTNLNVIASGPAADAYAIRFLGTHANNTIKVENTSVGVAMLPAEVSTIDIATVGTGGRLDVGANVTFSGTGGGGTLTITGGTSTLYCAPATLVARNSATVTLAGASAVYSSVSAINGVRLSLLAAMTITALTLQKSSNMNNSNNLGAVTITNATIDGDTCQVTDPNNGITWSNPATINGQVSTGVITFTGSRTMQIT